MPGRYELKQSSDGHFLFNLKDEDDAVLLTSERYKEKDAALAAIAAVQDISTSDESYDQRTAHSGEPYFVLATPKGEVVGRSQLYASTSAIETGVASVKSNGPSTEIVDQT